MRPLSETFPRLTFGISVAQPDGLIVQPLHRSPETAAKLDRFAFLRFAAEVAAVAERVRGEQLRLFEVSNG